MIRLIRRFLTLFFIVGISVNSITAEESFDLKRSVRIKGRKSVVVTTPYIHLGDLAEISSPRLSDDEIIIGLQKLRIKRSPEPGAKITISAGRVLEQIRDAGVDLEQVGYVLPRIMAVKRASRVLGLAELQNAVESYLSGGKRDVSIKKIDYKEDFFLIPGMTELKVDSFDIPGHGRMGFSVEAKVEGEQPRKLDVRATVNEWLEVPVATKSISRGEVIGERDLRMARLNMSTVPFDAEHSVENIIGLEASKNISFGEVFRRNKLSIPPVVEQGSEVTLLYKKGVLEATATGIALESGTLGQNIRIKNSGSKKIIVGTVLEPELIGVE